MGGQLPSVQNLPTMPNEPPETIPENVTEIPNTPPGDLKPNINPIEVQAAINVLCSIRVHKGKKLGDLILSSGNAWFLFLKQAPDIPDQERKAAEFIYKNWDDCVAYVSNNDLPF
jgi:hypothetical protein